ncbi:Chemotaxis protein CheY [Candidatus Desulfosporosinus infrequens]|uniref:Stage 0 sporulation protein A homolog n=1 Tax=Candidatus Desulfosporosinus infrequens TaxID=2043169 RepID=A0A2U3LXL2_9FIRM|nr:Chemotaxis protein CheY [Candidatus Desulfosporosinus infrequens]
MKRVLIVDNSVLLRLSLKYLFENIGFEVAGEADNGLTAVKLYKDLKPDVVTMDISMPELDGIEALKMIKTIDKDARIIIISALGHELKVKEAISAGAIAFIEKPFVEDTILNSS